MPKKISSHLLKTFEVFLNHPSQWLTMNEAVEKSGLNHNTLKAHIRFLTKMKVLDSIIDMRPYVYRLSESSDEYQEKLKYLLELNQDN